MGLYQLVQLLSLFQKPLSIHLTCIIWIWLRRETLKLTYIYGWHSFDSKSYGKIQGFHGDGLHPNIQDAIVKNTLPRTSHVLPCLSNYSATANSWSGTEDIPLFLRKTFSVFLPGLTHTRGMSNTSTKLEDGCVSHLETWNSPTNITSMTVYKRDEWCQRVLNLSHSLKM